MGSRDIGASFMKNDSFHRIRPGRDGVIFPVENFQVQVEIERVKRRTEDLGPKENHKVNFYSTNIHLGPPRLSQHSQHAYDVDQNS